jgi:hypothetical protein
MASVLQACGTGQTPWRRTGSLTMRRSTGGLF